MTAMHASMPPRGAFLPRAQEAFIGIARAATELTDAFEQLLRRYDLTLTQYNVLRILRGAEDGLCRNEIRDRMITRMPDVTRLLDRMEAAGLVYRVRESGDRRMVRTRLSDDGRSLVDRLDQPIEDEYQRLMSHLSPEQLETLSVLLRLVVDQP